MPVFKYSGRNSRGEPVTGRIEAATAQSLADQLGSLGIVPINIDEEVQRENPLDGFKSSLVKRRVKPLDLIFFSRQMFTMSRAGVPLMQSLQSLLQSATSPALEKTIRGISGSLNAGLDLTGALRSHPETFSRLYIAMIQVGEATGNLAETFAAMADYLQQESEIKAKVKSALRYPSFVIIAITIAMFIINIKVIPAFAGIFERLGSDLPLMTRILITSSDFTANYWYLIIGGIAGAVFAFRSYTGTDPGRLKWDRFKLRLPIVGSIMHWATLARFARALSITTRSGVSVGQALAIVGGAVDNAFVEQRVRGMQAKIEEGVSLSTAAEGTGLFPPLVLQMLRIGEETGEVDTLITEVAEFYEREVDYQVKNLSSVIEPILIVIITVMVLVIALGVFLPMWDLLDAAKGRK